MYALSQVVALVTALVCAAYVYWTIYFRRTFFNPLLYIVYGVFHWLVVGEIGTLLFHQNYYEPRSDFPAGVHVIATTVILSSVLAAIAGFHVSGTPLRAVARPWTIAPTPNRVACVAIAVGAVANAVLYYHIKTFTVDRAGFAYAVWILPLTFPAVSVGAWGAYLFFRGGRIDSRRRWLYRACGLLPFLVMISSNVFVVFVLYAFVFWWAQRNGKTAFISRKAVVAVTLSVPLALGATLVVKVVQRPDDLKTVFTISKLVSRETREEVIGRLGQLDAFNVEDYALLLTVVDRYDRPERFKLGATYLPLVPVLRLFTADIHGMGRTLAVEEGYRDTYIAFAAPPILELYANFGPLAPAVVYFLIGLAMQHVYRAFLASTYEVTGVVYAFFLAWLFFASRGDAVMSVVYPGYILLVMLVAYGVSRISVGSVRRLKVPRTRITANGELE